MMDMFYAKINWLLKTIIIKSIMELNKKEKQKQIEIEKIGDLLSALKNVFVNYNPLNGSV